MNRVDGEYRIDSIQRTNFPDLDLAHDLVRDIRDKTLAALKAVDLVRLI